MAYTLSIPGIGLNGNGTLSLGATAGLLNSVLQINGNGFTCPGVSVVNGSGTTLSNGSLQANNWYLNTLTINGSSSYNLTLNGGSDKDPGGVALAFTKIKLVAMSITNIATATVIPNGVDYLQIGPQGVANAAQLWFGGTTAAVYETMYWQTFHPGPAAGWTVNSTTASLLPIVNPGSNAITVAVLVVGN